MKRIAFFFTLIFVFSLLTGVVTVSATGTGELYSDNVQGTPLTEITIPIYIRNNPGLKGYTFYFTYDPTFMTPVSVERGEVVADGNFNDDIAGESFSEGIIKVVWNHSKAETADGRILYLHFLINSEASGVSSLQGSYDNEDTYDDNYDGISLSFTPVVIRTNIFGSPDYVLPAALKEIDENAFEGAAAMVVYVPDTCTSIGDGAFIDSKVTQIRIPSGCTIADNAFEGCENVTIFGKTGSSAEVYCRNHDNCTFIQE